MDLHSVFAPLVVLASSAIGAFAIAVGLDVIAGVLVAVKRKVFDWNKLPGFLSSQFGTVEARALLGLVIAATTTAVGSALIHGGLSAGALQGIADAALAAATAGSAAMMLSVLSDLFGKISQLTGRQLPAPTLRPAPSASGPPA